MMNNGKAEADLSREADLYYAFQFGYSSVREADGAAVKAEFDRKFGDDAEAIEQYHAGVRDEEAKRAELGMSPEQYHAHHAAKSKAFRERQEKMLRRTIGR